MQRFIQQPTRYTDRPPRYGPYVPAPPGSIPDLSLLTESGNAITTQSGSFLLQELAVGSAIEGAILAESQLPIVTQGSIYLRQD